MNGDFLSPVEWYILYQQYDTIAKAISNM